MQVCRMLVEVLKKLKCGEIVHGINMNAIYYFILLMLYTISSHFNFFNTSAKILQLIKAFVHKYSMFSNLDVIYIGGISYNDK